MSGERLRILVASRAFDNIAGGVERMAIELMNELAARGHRVTLVSWDEDAGRTFYPLDPQIVWRKIGGGWQAKAGWRQRLWRARRVRAVVREAQPDVMLAFQSGMFIALRLFTLGQGVPVIAAERNAPQRFEYLVEGKRRNVIFNLLRLAERITIQCASYAAYYPPFLQGKLTVIPNPVTEAACAAEPDIPGEKRLLCVGRLSYQKNQMVLLRAFAALVDEFSDWRLSLVGEGEARPALEAAVAELGLATRVELPGATTDIAGWYCRSQLFCLPSLWEGFPNALAESMAHGLPAVAFEKCAGMADLIEDGKTGWLAPGNDDAAALTAALRAAMQDGQTRTVRGDAAREAMRAYQPAEIFNTWESLLLTTARCDGRRSRN